MQDTKNKEFVMWLKQNAFKRDVTAQMQKDFQNKSVDEIAEEMADDIEQINVWKKNLPDIKAWYELEYFFERSYDDMEETWFSGEVFTFIPSSDSGNMDDLSMCWGIKNDLHLDLKLREWVERLEAEVHLADVYDEIPKKFGGDLETDGRFKYQDGNWVKFRYDSNRKEIIDNSAKAFKSIDDALVCYQETEEENSSHLKSNSEDKFISQLPNSKSTSLTPNKEVQKLIVNSMENSWQKNFYKSIGEEVPEVKTGLEGVLQKAKEFVLGIVGLIYFGFLGIFGIVIGIGFLVGFFLLIRWILKSAGLF